MFVSARSGYIIWFLEFKIRKLSIALLLPFRRVIPLQIWYHFHYNYSQFERVFQNLITFNIFFASIINGTKVVKYKSYKKFMKWPNWPISQILFYYKCPPRRTLFEGLWNSLFSCIFWRTDFLVICPAIKNSIELPAMKSIIEISHSIPAWKIVTHNYPCKLSFGNQFQQIQTAL